VTMVMGIWGANPLPVIHQQWHRNHLVCVSPADGCATTLVTVYGIGRTFRFSITMDVYRTFDFEAVKSCVDAILAEIDPIWLEIPAWEDRPRPGAAPDAQ
jgi:hypothetical protein